MDVPEHQESTTISFEWTIRSLKQLFDASRGEGKSKVTKSAKFGRGRWQILFYANSGSPPPPNNPLAGVVLNPEVQGHVSLYLSCEPTLEEKENAVNGKWTREGSFNFQFVLRPVGSKNSMFNSKEAHSHSFSSKTANWGWAQFARRDQVYYNSPAVRSLDAFTVFCTITSCAAAPTPAPANGRFVPLAILDGVGSLLDDPLYSDVEFVLPKVEGTRGAQRIYANKKLLQRADYFESMFNSGFSECVEVDHPRLSRTNTLEEESDGGYHAISDDSDEEEEDAESDGLSIDSVSIEQDTASRTLHSIQEVALALDTNTDIHASGAAAQDHDPAADIDDEPEIVSRRADVDDDDDEGSTSTRNVRQKLDHPSSPRSRNQSSPGRIVQIASGGTSLPGPAKQRVVVRDVAYNTYKAVLYYIYTDTIAFAPLSSSFVAASSVSPPTTRPAPVRTDSALPLSQHAPSMTERGGSGIGFRTQPAQTEVEKLGTSRREWLMEWMKNNPGRPSPCSAKSVYRLADRLDLRELKERAFNHIVKSLTVNNVPYEAFSSFSASYPAVRKIEVEYFLDNWKAIRSSNAMRNVWQQIRLGRHPGFEEVWPVIALSLEFKPKGEDGSEDIGDDSVGME